MRLAVRERDFVKVDTLQRLIASATTDTLMPKLLLAYHTGDRDRQRRLNQLYRNRGVMPISAAFWLASMGHIDAAMQYTDMASEIAATPSAATRARRIRGLMSFQQGRFEEGIDRIRSAGGGMPFAIMEVATFHWTPMPREEVERVMEQTRNWRAESSEESVDPNDIMHSEFRHYLLGLLALRLGDLALAEVYADSIEAEPVPGHWQPSIHALAEYIRSRIELAQGRSDAALARLERLPPELPLDLLPTPADRTPERLLRADLLLEAGRVDEALLWLQDMDLLVQYNYLHPYIQLRLAEIHARKGDADRAAQLYSSVLEQWRAADPSMEPLVETARQGLARLRPARS